MSTISCPYCNARISLAETLASAGRIECPRCGESFAAPEIHSKPQVATQTPVPPGRIAADDRGTTRPARRTVAWLVAGGMSLIGLVSLIYVLNTQGVRRARDLAAGPKASNDTPANEPHPSQWPGLGFLPESSEIVGGIRLAEAQQTELGRQILDLLPLVRTQNASQWLGIPLEEVRTLVAGGEIKSLPPRFTVAAVAQRAFDPRAIVERMGSLRTVEQAGRTLVRGKLWSSGPEGAVWFPSDTIALGTLLADDFERIPKIARTGEALCPPRPREWVEREVPDDSLAWLAGQLPANSAIPGLLASGIGGAGSASSLWKDLDAFALGLTTSGDRVTLRLTVTGRDEAGAEALGNLLAGSLGATEGDVALEREGRKRRLRITASGERLARGIRAALERPRP